MIATNIAEAAVSMAEAQAYARVETGEEEALLAGLVRSASALCESFIGQVLIARPFEEMLPATSQWQRLSLTPVRTAWAGQDGALAAFTEGGWRFAAPVEGARVLDRASGQMVVRRNGSWEAGIVRAQEVRINGLSVLRQRQPAVADPAGGGVVDAECRAAVASLLAKLRTHGLIA